jgi:hypothetical protein
MAQTKWLWLAGQNSFRYTKAQKLERLRCIPQRSQSEMAGLLTRPAFLRGVWPGCRDGPGSDAPDNQQNDDDD